MFIFHVLIEKAGGLMLQWEMQSLGIGRSGLAPDSMTNHVTLGKSLHLSGHLSSNCYTRDWIENPSCFLFLFSVILCIDFLTCLFFSYTKYRAFLSVVLKSVSL